jgi:hypothetical protein
MQVLLAVCCDETTFIVHFQRRGGRRRQIQRTIQLSADAQSKMPASSRGNLLIWPAMFLKSDPRQREPKKLRPDTAGAIVRPSLLPNTVCAI